nr:GntR family transcriptional regulator [Mesobacillus harenae]
MVEKKLIKEILDGRFPVGKPLLSERELSVIYRVGRPTIREAQQRLARDGWITFRKGLPAIVNDYWESGNLTTIVNIIDQMELIPDAFIIYLLELRTSLAPVYIREAITCQPLKVAAVLAESADLEDTKESYAAFDWKLQKRLASLCPNPIYLLILNSFDNFYIRMAEAYFENSYLRKISTEYYQELLQIAIKRDGEGAEIAVKKIMGTSTELWKNKSSLKVNI